MARMHSAVVVDKMVEHDGNNQHYICCHPLETADIAGVAPLQGRNAFIHGNSRVLVIVKRKNV
jgi:hypothetical protein